MTFIQMYLHNNHCLTNVPFCNAQWGALLMIGKSSRQKTSVKIVLWSSLPACQHKAASLVKDGCWHNGTSTVSCPNVLYSAGFWSQQLYTMLDIGYIERSGYIDQQGILLSFKRCFSVMKLDTPQHVKLWHISPKLSKATDENRAIKRWVKLNNLFRLYRSNNGYLVNAAL